jgi:hypothetical protein
MRDCLHTWFTGRIVNPPGSIMNCEKCGVDQRDAMWLGKSGAVRVREMSEGHLVNTVTLLRSGRAPALQYMLPALQFEEARRSRELAVGAEIEPRTRPEVLGLSPEEAKELVDSWKQRSHQYGMAEQQPGNSLRHSHPRHHGVAYRTPREIAELVDENERLKKRVAMLEAERGPGIKPPAEPIVALDIDWD